PPSWRTLLTLQGSTYRQLDPPILSAASSARSTTCCHGNPRPTIMADEKLSFEQTFTFRTLSTKTFQFIHNPKTARLLMKWSMFGRTAVQAFNFDQFFQPYKSKDFVWNFFQDPCVKNNLKVLDRSGSWTLLGDITHVNLEAVPCTKMSVDIFDPIFSNGILRPSGDIIKCYHEVYPDFDELRMLLLEEESEHYHIISPSDRQEFLFRLFKHMVLGGELCHVQKDPETKEISVVTTVLKVSAHDDTGLYYPSSTEHEQTFAYLCIDPFKRHVYVFYHAFGIGDFSAI
ncbi:hypothetical protein DNTS_004829, partial [Danionella cerebrum]